MNYYLPEGASIFWNLVTIFLFSKKALIIRKTAPETDLFTICVAVILNALGAPTPKV